MRRERPGGEERLPGLRVPPDTLPLRGTAPAGGEGGIERVKVPGEKPKFGEKRMSVCVCKTVILLL